MPFLFSSSLSSSRRRDDTVVVRRRRALARRLTVAFCAGLSVWLILQCVMSLVERSPVVVASVSISRGTAIDFDDMTVEQAPASVVTESAFHTTEDAAGLIAQVDIAKGEPIMRSMTSRTPVISAGRTAVEVTLASSPATLMPGRHVRLVAADRVLAESALVLAVPDRGSGESDGLLSGNAESGTVTIALTADEAMAVLAAQQEGPVLAVTIATEAEPDPTAPPE